MGQREETVIFQKIKKRTEAVGLGLEAARGSRWGPWNRLGGWSSPWVTGEFSTLDSSKNPPQHIPPPGSCSAPRLCPFFPGLFTAGGPNSLRQAFQSTLPSYGDAQEWVSGIRALHAPRVRAQNVSRVKTYTHYPTLLPLPFPAAYTLHSVITAILVIN